MIYINLFLYTFSNLLIGFIWPMGLAKRFRKISNLGYALIYYGIFLMPSYVKFFTVPYSLLFEIMYYSGVFGIPLFLIIAFKDKIWKKILFFLLMLIAMIAGESLSSTLLAAVGGSISVDFTTIESTWLMLMVISLDMIIMLILVFAWNIILRRQDEISGRNGFILAIPLSHLMLISATASLRANGESQLTFVKLIVLIVGVALEVVVLFLILLRSERVKNEEEIANLKEIMKTEEANCRRIEAEADALAMEQHDINNKVAVIRGLIESGDTEAALTFIEGCR